MPTEKRIVFFRVCSSFSYCCKRARIDKITESHRKIVCNSFNFFVIAFHSAFLGFFLPVSHVLCLCLMSMCAVFLCLFHILLASSSNLMKCATLASLVFSFELSLSHKTCLNRSRCLWFRVSPIEHSNHKQSNWNSFRMLPRDENVCSLRIKYLLSVIPTLGIVQNVFVGSHMIWLCSGTRSHNQVFSSQFRIRNDVIDSGFSSNFFRMARPKYGAIRGPMTYVLPEQAAQNVIARNRNVLGNASRMSSNLQIWELKLRWHPLIYIYI